MHLLLSLGLLLGLAPAAAQANAAPPNFSWNNQIGWVGTQGGGPNFTPLPGRVQIGRASCRERVCLYV